MDISIDQQAWEQAKKEMGISDARNCDLRTMHRIAILAQKIKDEIKRGRQ